MPGRGADRFGDDDYFEELTRAVFSTGADTSALDARWVGYRRAFSNFSIKDVSDYLPEDVDRLMSDPEIVRNVRKIEGTIENAAEMLMIQIDHGSFAAYLEGFESDEALAEDLVRRFRQLTPSAARRFVVDVCGRSVEA